MDRNKYLELCREVARLKSKNVPDNLKVEYCGLKYCPQSYTIWFDEDGKPKHSATLHDLKVNSIIVVDLDKVKGGD